MKSLYLNIDNQTLVQECRSGDRDALSILYTRFAPRMLRVISRYVSDKDSAQDILHDGFVAAFTRLDTLRDPDRLDFWLATIMKNLSLKFLQAQSISSILEDIPETIDDADPIETLDFATLESLVRQLPEGYQKVFRLAVLEGKSHKEISEILGIAPNSSSSQLFHAKIRLRQLIKDYQFRTGLISLLLLILSVGAFFFSSHDDISTPDDNFAVEVLPLQPDIRPMVAPDSTLPSVTNVPLTLSPTPAPMKRRNHFASASSVEVPSQEIIISSEDSVGHTPADTILITRANTPYLPESYGEDNIFIAEVAASPKRSSGWSVGISVDSGLAAFDSFGTDDVNDICANPCDPPSNPDDEDEERTRPSRIAPPASNIESFLGYASRRHYLPISFALMAEKSFSSWLGIESGIGYSYLHTDFERSTLNGNEVSSCHWHYLEIPLKANLYAYSNPRFKLYGSFGGKISIPVYSYASIPKNLYCQSGRFGSKPVWSIGVSLGMACRLYKRIDLFIEPSLRYHIPQDATVPNIWTDDTPWSFSLPIGFRLSW